MAKKVTLQMIADDLGYSKSLVSLALADYKYVHTETKSKVFLKAMQLGYDFKRKINRSLKFTLVFSTFTDLDKPYWSEVVTGLTARLEELKVGFEIAKYDKLMPQYEFLSNLIKRKNSGIIVVAACDDEDVRILSQPRLPILLLDTNKTYTTKCDVLMSSNYFSSFEAAGYLYGKGHRHIAFAGSVDASISFRQRYNGFCDFFKVHGGGCKIVPLINKGDDQFGIVNSKDVAECLKSGERPTAFFCANDPVAIRVFEIAQEIDLKIPDDISVVGYDGISSDHPFMKILTTFYTDRHAMGRTAADMILKRYNEPCGLPVKVEVPSVLKEGGSVKDISI
ncbi:MAG: LacI family transcriptional regulator [Clostridiales bacterium]|jgi:LacI family transcriptional regulator|nr:LacI family transcriptional regulator [Clostridiales bacterium]